MSNNSAAQRTLHNLESLLSARFGIFMSTEEVAATLKITVSALRMARSRKKFPLTPLAIEGRRGQIYSTADVARLADSWINKRKEKPM